MKRMCLLAALALTGCASREPGEVRDRELTKLRGERAALDRAITKDVKVLYRLQLHYRVVRRRGNERALAQLRGPLYRLHDRIEAQKEKAEELEQQIAVLQAEQDVVTGQNL